MRSSRPYWVLAAASILGLTVVAACSGGSNLSPAAVPLGGAAALTVPGMSAFVSAKHKKRGTAEIIIRIPRKKKSGRRMHPEYVSPSTQSMTVNASGQPLQVFNLTPSSAGCSTSSTTGYLTCTETAFFPSGPQAITIWLWDQQNGKGSQLSTATTSVTIAEGGTTTIPITLNGIVWKAKVLLDGSATASIPVGTPTSIPVIVDAYDADNNLVMLPGSYTPAVTLSDSDTSGATSLSESSATTPGESITLTYTGAAISSATIIPTVGSNSDANGEATLSVTASSPIAEYSIPTNPAYAEGIVKGPDGAMWFTEFDGGIGRITSTGTITEYGGLSASGPSGIAAGPDGALWFTENCPDENVFPPFPSFVGRITTGGSITEYSTPTNNSAPAGITAGPDGNLWFAERAAIGRITTGGSITEFSIPSGSQPSSITRGPDGALWFTEIYGSDQIGRITTDGTITEYESTVVPSTTNYGALSDGITTGPDGTLWFTGSHGTNQPEIGNITTTGATVGAYPLPTNPPGEGMPSALGITAGPDGALWFAFATSVSSLGSSIGRITTSGTVTMTAIPITGSQPFAIAPGPGGLWFTDIGVNSPSGRTPNAIGSLLISGSGARHRRIPISPTSREQLHVPAVQER
jgi:virginiamycin B lyase